MLISMRNVQLYDYGAIVGCSLSPPIIFFLLLYCSIIFMIIINFNFSSRHKTDLRLLI